MLDGDVMRRVVIGGERQKVGHVGFGRVVTSWVDAQIRGAVNQTKKTGSGSKYSKLFFFLFWKICQDLGFTDGNVGPDRVSRRASHFLSGKNSNNVTDVLLVFRVCRDRPCPTTAVLPRISHSFHRWCGIVRRFEWFVRGWVDLDVSGLEAVLAGLFCL